MNQVYGSASRNVGVLGLVSNNHESSLRLNIAIAIDKLFVLYNIMSFFMPFLHCRLWYP